MSCNLHEFCENRYISMKGYTDCHRILGEAFSLDKEGFMIKGSGVEYHTYAFNSDHCLHLPGTAEQSVIEKDFLSGFSDREINENIHFRYPVFLPEGSRSVDKAIILLHGLNEKSWNKYLPWARELVLRTGYAVILFPISFHMNRSPEDWGNPRNMSGLSRFRKNKYKNLTYSSFANAAMSERLDNKPERFALSGYQSVMDLLALVNNVSSGRHPLFKENTEIHFFGYSIGAFLSQVLMIANPGGIFNESRFLLFAGGNVFSRINGISRFIMDTPAFAQLRAFYLDEKQWRNKEMKSYVEVMDVKHVARAFMAMLSPDHFSPLREKVFKEFHDRIKVIALKDDLVFPLEYIHETFAASGIQVNMPDLPYPYTHEVPFPVSSRPETAKLVDQCFDNIFSDAAAFLKGK